MTSISIPAGLAASCRKSRRRSAWLEDLPRIIGDLARRWRLSIGAPFDGDVSCAWVALAERGGTQLVLKLAMPHMEGEHEIAGLRTLKGDPTVHLLEADEAIGAMLLERCVPGTSLRDVTEPEQDVVIATLLKRIWRTPVGDGPFRPLASMLAHWRDETLAHADTWPDPLLVREGLELLAQLSADASSHVLIATDLHAGNVLRAEREPWLVIDPKPFVGDPAYDATQHLLNCRRRLRTDPAKTIREFASLLEVDRERIHQWLFARAAAEPRDDWSDDSLQLARTLARYS
jgi:streptomycin 6-kinase